MSLLTRTTNEIRECADELKQLKPRIDDVGGAPLATINELLSDLRALLGRLGGPTSDEMKKFRARATETNPDRMKYGAKTKARVLALCAEFDALLVELKTAEATVAAASTAAQQKLDEEEAIAARLAAEQERERQAAEAEEQARRSAERAKAVARRAAAEAEATQKRLAEEALAEQIAIEQEAERKEAEDEAAAFRAAEREKSVARRKAEADKIAREKAALDAAEQAAAEQKRARLEQSGNTASGPSPSYASTVRSALSHVQVVDDVDDMKKQLRLAGKTQETIVVFWYAEGDGVPSGVEVDDEQHDTLLVEQASVVAFLQQQYPDVRVLHCAVNSVGMQELRPRLSPELATKHILSFSVHTAAALHHFPMNIQSHDYDSSQSKYQNGISEALDAADAFAVTTVLRSRRAGAVDVLESRRSVSAAGPAASTNVSSAFDENSGQPSSSAASDSTTQPKSMISLGGVVSCLRRLKASTASPKKYLKALSLLKQIISKIIEHPTESRYQRIRVLSKAYQGKLANFDGGPECMNACGFRRQSLPTALDDDDYFVLAADLSNSDELSALKGIHEVICAAVQKLESAASAPSSAPARAPAPAPAPLNPGFGQGFGSGFGNAPAGGFGGFAPGFGSGAAPPFGGAADFASMMSNPMVQNAMRNPELMRSLMAGMGGGDVNSIMQSPMARQLMENPAMLQAAMQQMQQNPGLMEAARQAMGGMGMGLGGLGGFGSNGAQNQGHNNGNQPGSGGNNSGSDGDNNARDSTNNRNGSRNNDQNRQNGNR